MNCVIARDRILSTRGYFNYFFCRHFQAFISGLHCKILYFAYYAMGEWYKIWEYSQKRVVEIIERAKNPVSSHCRTHMYKPI